MGKDRLDDFGGLDTSDDTHSRAALRTVLDVDAKNAFEPVHPAQRGTGRRGITFGAVSLCGDDVVTVLEVRGEPAVVSSEMGAGAWHEGGEPGEEVDGVEHDMSRPITEGVLEPIHDLCAVIDREAFVHRLRPVAQQKFQDADVGSVEPRRLREAAQAPGSAIASGLRRRALLLQGFLQSMQLARGHHLVGVDLQPATVISSPLAPELDPVLPVGNPRGQRRGLLDTLLERIQSVHTPAQRAGCPRNLVDDWPSLHASDPQLVPEANLRFALSAALVASVYLGDALSFAVYALASQPALCERIQAEADALFENGELTRDFLMAVPITLAGALGLERPVYMGSSIGGHLAIDLALSHPREFRAVVGLEASAYTPGGFVDEFNHPRIGNDFKAHLMYGMMAPTSPEALRRETAWVYSQGAPAVFKGDLYYYAVDHDVRNTAATIDTEVCSVDILNGEYDWSGTPEAGEELAAMIPGARYKTMKGLGHFPMSENPARFLSEIRPVLERILSR